MSYTIFRLTDGTITQSLIGSGVFLQEAGGPPKLLQLGEETLGQVGPYQDMQVEIEINITTAGAITTNQIIRQLQTWQYQARRWNDGVPGIAAVRLEAQITGSTAGLMDAVVLDLDLELPDDYHDLFVIGQVDGATLRMTLRVFLAAQETAVNSSATNVGDIFTITLASTHPLLSPLRLTWTAPNSGRNPAEGPLIITGSSSDLGVLDGETLGAGGAYSLSTPVNTAVARGTQVLRFTTPAGLREARQVTYANIPAVLKSGPVQVDIWAVGAAYDDADLFTLAWQYGGGNDQTLRISSAIEVRGESGSAVRAFYAGTLDVPEGGLDQLYLDVEGAAVGDLLDIDYVVFVVQRHTTFVMQPFVYAATNVFGTSNTMRGVWDAAQTTTPDPLIAVERTTGSVKTSASPLGDAWVGAQGSTLAGIWLAVDRFNAFRYPSASGATTPLSVTYSAARRRAYPLPE
jgi:hypothetical protein